METPLNLGEKVRVVRILREITQDYVAEKMGISQQAYQKLEKSKTIMTEGKLTEIAKILDVETQMIRDIDKFPIINTNIKNCQQFGNFQPTYHNYGDKENNLNQNDRLHSIEEEVKTLKSLIETFTNSKG
ncbi:MAG: helix-turn-helix transcriptional regulator [Arcicella sp.]|nr:helix-turn-helix transcriptional regulator [Arcicella sp.]